MVHFWTANAARLKVDTQTREDSVDLSPSPGDHPQRLGEVEDVEDRRNRCLRHPLHTQVTVLANAAHHVARLVHRDGDESVRRAGADGHHDVRQVVDVRIE